MDAGFDQDNLNGSVGAIIRNHSEQFIVAANEILSSCYDAFTPEAIAVIFRLDIESMVGCCNIKVALDNEGVVNDLNEGGLNSIASVIIDDCFFMKLDFNHVLFEHCNRDCNHAAHELAKLAKYSTPSV